VADVVPTTPEGAIAAIVALLPSGPDRPRVAIDGAPGAAPDELAELLVAALAPRRALHVRADHFWRPASERFEFGRHDPDAWLGRWLDTRTLEREVLHACAAGGRVLPGLRDPLTDRSMRVARVSLPPGAVLVVSGSALLGRGLSFDAAVHMHLTPGALLRRTASEDRWILPALDAYEATIRPDEIADLVVRADDPRHPALVRRRAEP